MTRVHSETTIIVMQCIYLDCSLKNFMYSQENHDEGGLIVYKIYRAKREKNIKKNYW